MKNTTHWHKYWVLTCLLTLPLVAAADGLNVFKANEAISSSQVNANFKSLQDTIAALEKRVATAEAAASSGAALEKRVAAVETASSSAVAPRAVSAADFAGADHLPHWNACLANGNAINCGVAANRVCTATGYKAGFWVGEYASEGGASRLITCLK